MKKSFCLLLCVMLVASLTACFTSTHEHEYNVTKWESNDLMHWYAATCEHTEERASVGLHTDTNNDGACDVCAHGSDHVHTFDDEWTVDENNHWYAVTCGHSVDAAEKGAHVDANNDSICDTCAYDYNHTHTYDTSKWSADATNHWHAVTCGHAVSEANKAAHVDENLDGECDVCAWVDASHTHTATTTYLTDATYHWFVCADHSGYVMSKTAHTGLGDDGVCDVCGWYDAEHTHTYASAPAWSYDDNEHWLAANCGHSALKTSKGAHADANNDGECDTCGWSAHEHTPDNGAGYQTSDTQHWIGASCGCDVKFVLENHVDENNDGVCEVCGWYDETHTHTYSEEWSKDEKGHWHDTTGTCEHDLISEYGEHTGMDDGACDECGYTDFDSTHTHTTEEVYSKNYTHHWYAITCSHTAFVEKVAHTDEDVDGYCDVCLGETFAHVIATATSDEYKAAVKNGNVSVDNSNYGTSNYYYEFGDSYLFVLDEVAGWKYWYHNYNDSLFAMNETGSGVQPAYTDSEIGLDYLNGVEIDTGYYVTGAYGLENAIAALYSQAENYYSYLECYENNGVFVFSYDYLQEGYYTYIVEVTVLFEIDTVSVYDYSIWDEVTYDYVSGAVILVETYEAEAAESGYAKVEGEPYMYVYYTATQNGGSQTAESPFNPDDYFVGSYDLLNGEDVVTSETTITVELGSSADLYYANVDSKTGDFSFEDMIITVVDAEGNVYDGLGVADYGEYLNIGTYSAAAGTYTVTVETAKTEKTFKVVVKVPETTSLETAVTIDGSKTVVTSYDVFVGATIDVMSKVNSRADARYSIVVTGDNASDAVVVVPESTAAVGQWNYYYGAASQVTFNKAGVYTIVLTSLANSELTATLTVTVTEPPEIEDVLNGSYAYSDMYMSGQTIYVTFTPDAEGALTGTANIYLEDEFMALAGSYTVKYSYDEDNGLVLTNTDGSAFNDLLITYSNYVLTAEWSYEGWWGPEYTSGNLAVSDPYTPPAAIDIVAGEYRYYSYDENYNLICLLIININDDGTGTYTNNVFDDNYNLVANVTTTFNVEASDNGDGTYAITISDVVGSELNAGTYNIESVETMYGGSVDNIIGVSVTLDGTTSALNFEAYI